MSEDDDEHPPEPRDPIPRTPHDALFRDTFGVPARATTLLKSLLPAQLSEHIAWHTLTLADSSFIDPHLHPQDCDLLFDVELLGQPAHIYLLLEHQSTRDHYMALRMLSYLVRIWQRLLERRKQSKPSSRAPLPIVIPVLVSHAEGGWRAPVVFHDLFDPALRELSDIHPLVPNFTLLLDDLAGLSDADLRARGYDNFIEVVYFLLRDGREVERLLDSADIWIALFAELLRGDEFYIRPEFEKLLRYLYVVCSRELFSKLEAKLIRAIPMHKDQIMTYGEELIQQGLERGRWEGRQEGRQETLRSTLERLVALKYGTPTPTQRANFDAASPDRLAHYIDRILTAATLEQLLAD